MLSAEREVTIARPVAEVFAFVADGLNAPSWRPGVMDISLASGTGLGAVYKQGVKGPGGRPSTLTTGSPPTNRTAGSRSKPSRAPSARRASSSSTTRTEGPA